ncbi:hypothetical protein [Nonomuraea candida]|uniref:hypothetical protein n=1 Tax=Nonomuraea candida TaxID=359159 RepID=UPI0005B86589|nr:hypothetical protein [Nonomuraea candida]
MVTRATATALAALFILTVNAGCVQQSSPPPTKTTAAPQPVTDSSPYWCDVIPQEAIRTISGLAIPLDENKDGVPTTHGACSLRNEYNRFSLNWSIRDGEGALDRARANFGRKQLSELPADLGRGLIAYTGNSPRTKPYVAFMLFRCDDNRPWMGMDVSQVAQGRDPVKDFTALLRIARERYGRLHDCVPEAA